MFRNQSLRRPPAVGSAPLDSQAESSPSLSILRVRFKSTTGLQPLHRTQHPPMSTLRALPCKFPLPQDTFIRTSSNSCQSSTSPSMYFAVENMQASDYCHTTIGPVLNTTFAVRTEGLSTAHFVSVSNPGYALAHFTGIPQVAAWYPFNIDDYTSCKSNENTYNSSDPLASAAPGEGPGWFPPGVAKTRVTMLTNILNPNGLRITEIWNPCRPWIGFPTEVLGLAPQWSSCTTSIWPLYDPPYALSAQSRLAPAVTAAGPTTVAPALPITTAADPGNKPTMFAPITATAMAPAASPNPPSNPNNGPIAPAASPSKSADPGVQNPPAPQSPSVASASAGIAGIIISMLNPNPNPNPIASPTTAPAPAPLPDYPSPTTQSISQRRSGNDHRRRTNPSSPLAFGRCSRRFDAPSRWASCDD